MASDQRIHRYKNQTLCSMAIQLQNCSVVNDDVAIFQASKGVYSADVIRLIDLGEATSYDVDDDSRSVPRTEFF